MLAAERLSSHHYYCLDNCVMPRHCDDSSLRGIERACLSGCMKDRFARMASVAFVGLEPPQVQAKESKNAKKRDY